MLFYSFTKLVAHFSQPLRLCCLLFTVSAFAANETAWRYKIWDTDVVVPEGAYRGDGKPVTLEGSHLIAIGPGAVIENTKLHSEATPHVKIEGSLVRDLELSSESGLQFEAKDSALEVCGPPKSGYYEGSSSATKWHYENCVIARDFFGKGIYSSYGSVVATNCTFYNISLPKVTYRGDPAAAAQTDQLKFDHCKFVNCEVTDSFLLATVECVFENCRFPAKHEEIPKLKGAINVTAYFVSRANPPKPYENGPIKIEFKGADGAPESGAKIPVTNTSGRLTYTTIKTGPAQNLGLADGATSLLAKAEAAGPGRPKPGTSTPPAPVGEKGLNLFPTGPGGTTPATVAVNGVVPLKSQRASLSTPLFQLQQGGGFAALDMKVTATATANAMLAAGEIACPAFPGPDGVRAMGFVKQQLLKRHNGWPKAAQIDIACPERPVAADLPAALLTQALVVDSLILGYNLDSGFVAIGGFDIDGNITPALATGTRVLAAIRGGATRIVVPEKSTPHVADVMLAEGPAKFSNVQIFAVGGFEEIPPLATKELEDKVVRATAIFGRAQAVLRDRGDAGLTDQAVKEALRQCLIEAPNHLSARLLLGHGAGQFNNFTIAGSIETIEQRAPNLVRAARCSVPSSVAGIPADRPADELAKIKALREKLDDKAQPWLDALVRYGTAVNNWHANPTKTIMQNSQLVTEMTTSGRLVQTEWAKLIAARDAGK